MGTYSTSDFRKGLKVQIDGTPYLMIEMNFRKPGKGNALYECKLRNLLRGTTTDNTSPAGHTLESADVSEFNAQYLYRQGEDFVFMKNDDYEQYEMSAEGVGDAWKFLKENMDCQVMVYNDRAIAYRVHHGFDHHPERHLQRRGRSRQHGHQRHQALQGGDGGRDIGPGVRQHRRLSAGRHADRGIYRACQGCEFLSD